MCREFVHIFQIHSQYKRKAILVYFKMMYCQKDLRNQKIELSPKKFIYSPEFFP